MYSASLSSETVSLLRSPISRNSLHLLQMPITSRSESPIGFPSLANTLTCGLPEEPSALANARTPADRTQCASYALYRMLTYPRDPAASAAYRSAAYRPAKPSQPSLLRQTARLRPALPLAWRPPPIDG
eukprot:COSAG06_NODE_785_length_12306_cov_22.984435_11_plen_129_part_00